MALKLRHLHPEFDRTCKSCITFIYNEDGTICKRAGQPQPRPKGVPTPCDRCPKIPDDAPKSPEHAIEPTSRSLAVIDHYDGCRAVASFPDDPIVKANATIIRRFMDDLEKTEFRLLITKLALRHTAG
jgi:hypothetical protein